MKANVLILAAALLLACSPQKRLARLVEKHPELMQTDTVTIIDTFIRNKHITDTVFSVKFDSVIINNERVKVRLVRLRDTIYSTITVKGDTIIRTIKQKYQKVVVTPQKWYYKYWQQLAIGLLLFVIVLILSIKFR